MMKMFIQTFLKTAESALVEINQQLEARNWPDLRRVAHSLKPQLSYMGITMLAPVIVQIEEQAGNETALETMPALVAQLSAITRQAMEELRKEAERL